MYDLLLSRPKAKTKVTALFDRHDVGPLDEDVGREWPDDPAPPTELQNDRLLDLLWIERFDAMFGDHSLILGEAISEDGEAVPVAWHDKDGEWVPFDHNQQAS